MKSINSHDDVVAGELQHWKRVRDCIEGARAIRRGGTLYLPKENPKQTTAAYLMYRDRVSWFPATSRTLDGLMGLIFRRRPVFEGDATMQLLDEGITQRGLSLEQFVERVTREAFTTNFAGVLVDMPAVTDEDLARVSAANQIDEGQRPFLSLYRADQILGVPEFAFLFGRTRMSRVRLLEDEGNTVRELLLTRDGYSVVLHLKDESTSEFKAQPAVTPLMQGAPLREIPFVIVSTNNSDEPTKGALDEVAELNIMHYRAEGMLASIHYYSSAPVPYVIGAVEPEEGWGIAPGETFTVEEKGDGVEFGFWEFEGKGVDSIERKIGRLENDMARVGARILASERSGTEAAETHAIRRASENATLAAASRSISAKMDQVMKWVAAWIGSTAPVSFALNTDYLPRPYGAQEITAIVNAWQKGLVSHETAFLAIRDGEVINEKHTFEEEQKRLTSEAPERAERDALALQVAEADGVAAKDSDPAE